MLHYQIGSFFTSKIFHQLIWYLIINVQELLVVSFVVPQLDHKAASQEKKNTRLSFRFFVDIKSLKTFILQAVVLSRCLIKRLKLHVNWFKYESNINKSSKFSQPTFPPENRGTSSEGRPCSSKMWSTSWQIPWLKSHQKNTFDFDHLKICWFWKQSDVTCTRNA